MQVPHSSGSSTRWSRLWLLALAPLGAAVGLGASYFSPPVYRASVSVLILAPKVHESLMPANLNARLSQRLKAISMQVLSSTQLERIIRDFDLYARERQSQPTEDASPRMRQDISLSIVASGESGALFTVAYHAANPQLAMRVVERLASLFVHENLADAERLSNQINTALQPQLEEQGKRLAAVSVELDEARRGTASSRPVAVLEVEHQVIRDQYQALFESAQNSRPGQLLERHSIGDQFRILDPARLPQRPIEPVRLVWSGLGAAAGLIVACVAMLVQWRPRPPRIRPEGNQTQLGAYV